MVTGGGWVPENIPGSFVHQSKHIGGLNAPAGRTISASGLHEAFAICLDLGAPHVP